MPVFLLLIFINPLDVKKPRLVSAFELLFFLALKNGLTTDRNKNKKKLSCVGQKLERHFSQ